MDRVLLNDKLGDRLALAVCEYLDEKECRLHISRPRKTKYGDFRVREGACRISVNRDLNPHRFALTLFHELAHLETYRRYGSRVKAHGKEWKGAYAELLHDLDVERLFRHSEDLMKVLETERRSPRAQAGLYGIKEQVLGAFDPPDERITLLEVPVNERFTFNNREYVKLKDQRSRALCLRRDNQRRYTISLSAKVER